MDNGFLTKLNAFIVRAKAATYVGGGKKVKSCRPGSHDLKFADGDWSYMDSYFGGRDFIGEETVFLKGVPVWAENYYGRILRSDLITPAQAGEVIKASLSKMYAAGHFLGEFDNQHQGFLYVDTSAGDAASFSGRETISINGTPAYELSYHGGLILED